MTSFLSKINFFQDFTFLIAVIILTLAVAFLVGRHRLLSLFFGIYISLALLGAISIKYIQDSFFQAIFFLAVVCVITIFGRKIIGLYVSKSDLMWRIIVLSFLEVMAVLSIMASILPKKTVLDYVSKNAYNYLISPDFYILWLVLPLIFVYFIRKKLS